MSFEPVLWLLALFLAAIPIGATLGVKLLRSWKPMMWFSFACALIASGAVLTLPLLNFSGAPGLSIWFSLIFWITAWFAAVGAGVVLGRWTRDAGETRRFVAIIVGVLLVPVALTGVFWGTMTIACSRAFGGQGCW